jgi:hypothetical protein
VTILATNQAQHEHGALRNENNDDHLQHIQRTWSSEQSFLLSRALAWVGRGELTTRVLETQSKDATHALQVRKPVARNWQANESRASTAIHSVGVWQHADCPS